jgi:2'-hydroxyisoflavone reductase
MKILFLGGTRFVGRAMVDAAVARGHEVEVFHRGNSSHPLPPQVKSLIGDRTKDFTALQTGTWDVVIDTCGYRPHEIHAMSDVLIGRIKKYVFVSTVSVYSNSIPFAADEDAELASTKKVLAGDPITMPIDGHTYGPLKVLCEEAVTLHYPDALIIRPTYVVGAFDYTDRYPTWVRRMRDSAHVQCPNPSDAPMQYIDAQDLAELTMLAIEQNVVGPVNAASVGPGYTFGAFLNETRDAINADTTLEWVDAPEDGDYPLWTGGEHSTMLSVSNERAKAIGLSPRPLSATAHEVLEWCNQA